MTPSVNPRGLAPPRRPAYAAGMDEITGDEIAQAGRAAFGEHWLTPLCAETKIHERDLRRVLKGTEKAPADFRERLVAMLERRGAAIALELGKLTPR